MRTFTTASLSLLPLVLAVITAGSSAHSIPDHCDAAKVSVAQAAYLRGLSPAATQMLIGAGVTPYDVCHLSEAMLRRIVDKAQKPKPTHPGEYLAWRNESLRDENGVIDANGLMQARAHVDLMRMLSPEAPLAAGIARNTWTSIGPGNVGGRVRAMVINPVDPNIMIIGSVAGGIWRTTNGGTSWSAVDDFMANLAVSTIVMDPLDPNVLYAGTGEGYYNADGIRGAGIFKSTDNGVTWAQLGSTSASPGTGTTASDFYYVNRLTMSPNGTTLLAATRTGIFRSTNGGTTFARATLVGGGAISVGLGITDIDFHPTDNSRAVAGTFAGTSLYSIDGGATWTLAAGMPGGSTFRRVETAFAPSQGSTVYAGVDLEGGSLYRSLDGGQTYTEIFDGGTDTVLNPLEGQGWYDNLLWVSPADVNFIVWGGVDNFKSTNGGQTFSKISQWFSHSFSNPTSAHADQHIAVAHPGFNGASNRTVFFANDGGVYRATDVSTVGGDASPYQAGWTELNNGLPITQFYGAAGHPATGRVTGGTQDNGTLFYNPSSVNASENWTEPFGGDGGFSAYDSADSNYFYGEYIYLTIHRNTTGGASGSQYIWSGLSDANNSSNSEFIAAFILDPNNNNRLLAGAVRLWRTNNVKASVPAWEEIKATLGLSDRISAIAVAPSNSDIIYAGHNSGRLYKTTIGTSAAATVRTSWATIDDNLTSNPLPNRRVTRITIDPNDTNIVYVTFGGFSGDNIYKSTNGGTSWTDITGASGGATALPDVPVRDLEIHPSNSNWIYAGTEVGIFASENGGATWTLPQDGPSNVSVDELFFLGSTLYAATHGRGLFRTNTLSAPTISTIGNQTTTQGTAVTASFTVADSDTALASLTLSGSSSNTTLLPNAAIAFSGSGGNRSVTLTPASGQHGTSTITISVSDGTTTASTTFVLTVTAPPTIASVANQMTAMGAPVTATLAIDDPDTATTSLTLSGSSSNTTLLPNSGISFGGSGASRTITLSPASGQIGSATVTVTVSDGSASASTSFVVTVTAAPTISAIANQITTPGTMVSAPFTIADADTALSSLTLAGTSSNTTLLPNASITFGGSGENRTVTLTPASGQHGSTTVTLTVSDGSNAASTSFVLTMTAPPTIGAIPNQLTTMATPVSVSFTVADPDTAAGSLAVSGTSSNTTLVPNSNLSFGGTNGSRSVTITPATGQTGTTVITVVVTDGTAAASQSFTLTTTTREPGPVLNLAANVVGNQLTVTWNAPSSGLPPTEYVLFASLTPGGTVVASISVGSALSFSTGAPDGQYFLTVRARNAAGFGPAGSEVGVNIGSFVGRPGPPRSLRAAVTDAMFTLNWTAPDFGGAPTAYLLSVGSSTGASNLASELPIGAATTFTTPPLPNGRYYVRLRAQNNVGQGATSEEVVVLVGPPPPGAPTLSGSAGAGAASISWTPPTVGGAVAGYEIRVGSASGLSNLAVLPVSPTQLAFSTGGVPSGTYFIRIVAVNSAGEGPASNEITLVVP